MKTNITKKVENNSRDWKLLVIFLRISTLGYCCFCILGRLGCSLLLWTGSGQCRLELVKLDTMLEFSDRSIDRGPSSEREEDFDTALLGIQGGKACTIWTPQEIFDVIFQVLNLLALLFTTNYQNPTRSVLPSIQQRTSSIFPNFRLQLKAPMQKKCTSFPGSFCIASHFITFRSSPTWRLSYGKKSNHLRFFF